MFLPQEIGQRQFGPEDLRWLSRDMADFQGQTLQVDWEPGLEGLIEGVKGAEKQKEHFLTVRK